MLPGFHWLVLDAMPATIAWREGTVWGRGFGWTAFGVYIMTYFLRDRVESKSFLDKVVVAWVGPWKALRAVFRAGVSMRHCLPPSGEVSSEFLLEHSPGLFMLVLSLSCTHCRGHVHCFISSKGPDHSLRPHGFSRPSLQLQIVSSVISWGKQSSTWPLPQSPSFVLLLNQVLAFIAVILRCKWHFLLFLSPLGQAVIQDVWLTASLFWRGFTTLEPDSVGKSHP